MIAKKKRMMIVEQVILILIQKKVKNGKSLKKWQRKINL